MCTRDPRYKIHALARTRVRAQRPSENTKEVGYECTEFQSSQFILAHLQWHEVKHKRRPLRAGREGEGKKGWEGGNRRSGFAPVVSEGSERRRTNEGMKEKWKKERLSGKAR